MRFDWTTARRARHSGHVSWIVALLVTWLGGVPAWAGDVADVRVADEAITVTLDGAVAGASTFVLDSPRRIALDIAGASPGARVSPGGPVARVRQGAMAGGARLVFDLDRPTIVREGRFDAGRGTLTLVLKRVDGARFARAAAAGRLALPGFDAPVPVRSRDRGQGRVSMAVPPARKAPKLPRIYGDDPSRPLVVIDAGHGGKDPGAINPDAELQEKEITLKTALAIKDRLLESGRVRVALTREDDRFLILQERYGIARRLGADLFISVHCDSAGNPMATGATAYTLSEIASDKEAARLAARENKADIIAGINLGDQSNDISSLLIDLAQRETMNRSANFARLLGREARPLMPTKNQFHRMASLVVLKAPDMPSVLFETGYISNKNDAEFLGSKDGRKKVAESVSRATEIYFARRLASR
ncbi:N-acetylmuramoyl-L-alanine amidase [Sphingomonas sp.]|uniref:N-acetylmuramoyl-L-alanine amidase n=1 Tax=Sphingomonas sp. TaxID=28214 RepID=UPI002B852D78|nr:N-acetylmuramoyl-L-alanine amidase [Sphingomonas sp.]HTG37262.1 N-acetylmuramoyl-L-alanine amidase [Sphingomonas sp.]